MLATDQSKLRSMSQPVSVANASRTGGQVEKAMSLITRTDRTVAVTVQTRAAASPQHAFEVNVPIDLSLVFKGWGPFPAVRAVKNQTGAWDHVGASRNPVLPMELRRTRL